MIAFARCHGIRTASKPIAAALYTALAAALTACGNGNDAPSSSSPPLTTSEPADPLFRYQWHLVNTGQIADPGLAVRGLPGVDLNVAPVWQRGIDGKGVTVAVVDDSLEVDHEDLRANIAAGLSHDYGGGDSDPTPPERRTSHGTAVAGIIAAARNRVGGVGVAPGVKLAGFNVLKSPYQSDVIDALGRGTVDGSIAVSNNSWGPRLPAMPTPGDRIMEEVIRKGADRGRAGRGIVYVFAAGNENKDVLELLNSNSATPHYTPSNFYGHRPKQVLTVCAVNANGLASAYSASGSNLLVCAPSDDVPNLGGISDMPGITTSAPFGQYVHTFGGTSAAAPAVSGVIALMLQANPNLTWRDVRLILARTARILPSMERDPSAQWIDTAAENPHTGKRYRYSTRYGFGLADADAAVSYARRFISVGGSSQAFWDHTCTGYVGGNPTGNPGERLGNEAASIGMVEQGIQLQCGYRNVEFLEAEISLEHPNFRALRVTLESPLGTKIVLSPAYPRCEASFERRGLDADCGTESMGHYYRTHAVTVLEEPASGTWTLRVEDTLETGAPVRLRAAAIHIT